MRFLEESKVKESVRNESSDGSERDDDEILRDLLDTQQKVKKSYDTLAKIRKMVMKTKSNLTHHMSTVTNLKSSLLKISNKPTPTPKPLPPLSKPSHPSPSVPVSHLFHPKPQSPNFHDEQVPFLKLLPKILPTPDFTPKKHKIS